MEKEKAARMSAADFGLDEEEEEEEEDMMATLAKKKVGAALLSKTDGMPSGYLVPISFTSTYGPCHIQLPSNCILNGILTLQTGKAAAAGRGRKAPVVETVSKHLGDLSTEERGAALMADAPELLALLQDLTDSLTEVRQPVKRNMWDEDLGIGRTRRLPEQGRGPLVPHFFTFIMFTPPCA